MRPVSHWVSLAAALVCTLGFGDRLLEYMRLGSPVSLGIAIFYAILVGLFINRAASRQAEIRPIVWVMALGATYLPMLMQTSTFSWPDWLSYGLLALQYLALVGMIVALCQLGRGFGVLPAVRQVKTHGLYRWIRHPLYATEMLFMGTVLATCPSTWNVSVYLVFIGLQAYRALLEERLLLAHDPVYQQYASQVRYRFIPFIC